MAVPVIMKGTGQACVTRTMSDKTSLHTVGVGPEINTLLTREKLSGANDKTRLQDNNSTDTNALLTNRY